MRCSRRAPWSLALAVLVGLAIGWLAGCQSEPERATAPLPPPAPLASDESASATTPSAPKPLRSPKPGERVRQQELDGYCEGESAVAFYYHGGNSTTRVARNDRCTPLFLSECESEGRCYPPRDQEPGMWCCAPRPDEEAHAAR